VRFRLLLPFAVGAGAVFAAAALQQPHNSPRALESIPIVVVASSGSALTAATDDYLAPSTDSNVDDLSVASSVSAPTVYLAGDFRLSVPFRTQKDGSRFQGANCGPASLSMVLAAFDMSQNNPDLRWLTQEYQGNPGGRGGTYLHDLASVGKDFGLTPVGLYAGEGFAHWTTDDIEEQLRAGRPVIAQVKYRLLPDHSNVTINYDHYVVIHGMQGDSFIYNDPIYSSADEGAAHLIKRDQLALAMKTASVSQHAVAFAAGTHAALIAQAI
jgi:hypothetical protein